MWLARTLLHLDILPPLHCVPFPVAVDMSERRMTIQCCIVSHKRTIQRKLQIIKRGASGRNVLKDGLVYYSYEGDLKQRISNKDQQKQVIVSFHADNLGRDQIYIVSMYR